ncbi:MAG: RNA 3'-terminal phosphate cyclase [Desulfomonilaceae bacterium]
MIEIDGSMHSGSGTLLRYAVALATLTGQPLHMIRIRAKRPKPGLRAQHLNAVISCCAISQGRVEGAEVGSQEIVYRPGDAVKGGDFEFDIGTAGSAAMAAFTLIPPCLFARETSRLTITGGLFQDFAPSFFHMQKVLVPMLVRMGADVRLEMLRPGYVPKGGGRLTMTINPGRSPLKPLRMMKQGIVETILGIALSSHLAEQSVSRRMADACAAILRKRGYAPDIRVMEDSTAAQRGAALTLWGQTDGGCLLGSDQAGKPGRKSEAIADFVARSLLKDLDTGATTDRHLADQLILFAALAGGTTEYTIPALTEHVTANLWLVQKMLGVEAHLEGKIVRVKGVGYAP